MSSDHRWFKFWPQDWQRDPALRSCGVAARGLWMDLLCIMHEGEPYGHLTIGGKNPSARQIGTITGVSEKDAGRLLEELESVGVFSRNADGVIYSRRMVRDGETSRKAKVFGGNGGNPDFIRGTVPKDERVRPFKRTDSPAKTDRIFNKSGGKCHWCGASLQRNEAGSDFFHVDHVVAVRDGGSNDDDNLVAACAACNHKRARHYRPTPTSDSNSDSNSDTNCSPFRPQTLETEFKRQSSREEEKEPFPSERCLTKPGYTSDFEEWWAAYPERPHDNKATAARAYAKACKSVSAGFLMEQLRAYPFSADPQYRRMAATWLNQRSWEDRKPEPKPTLLSRMAVLFNEDGSLRPPEEFMN